MTSRCKPFAGIVGIVAVVAVTAGHAAAVSTGADTAWLDAAHQTNLAEIAAGNAALQQASSGSVKDLAQMFITMHTDNDTQLTAAAGQLGVTLPDAPTPDQQADLARVGAEQGAAFDVAWIASQIAGHQAALQATTTEATSGTDATVVALAATTAPVVQQHLTALQQEAAAAGAPNLVQTGDGGLVAPDNGTSFGWILAAIGIALTAGGSAMLVLLRRR